MIDELNKIKRDGYTTKELIEGIKNIFNIELIEPKEIEFNITRSSDWKHKEKPYKNAFTYLKEEEFYKEYLLKDAWKVKIKTIQDLMKIIDDLDGQEIILDGHSIEIYDDYRE